MERNEKRLSRRNFLLVSKLLTILSITIVRTNAEGCRAALLSIGLFMVTLSWGQSVDSVERVIEERLTSIEADYYYTKFDTALTLYRQVAEQAAQHNRWDLHLKSLLQIAWCADYHSEMDTLQHYLKQAKEVKAQRAQALDSLDKQQSIRLMVPYTEGMYYYAVEDFLQSIESFSEIISPSSPALRNDSMLVFGTYSYIGQAYNLNANYQRASQYHHQAIQWLPHSYFQGDIRNYYYYQALNYLYLGQCHLNEAQYGDDPNSLELAERNFFTALGILRKHLNSAAYQNSIYAAYAQLAELHRLQKNYDSALWYLDQTILFRGEDHQQETYYYVGRIHKDQGNYQTALQYLNRSLSDSAAIPRTDIASSLVSIGEVYTLQNNFDSAIFSYQSALSVLTQNFVASDIYENPSLAASDIRPVLLRTLAAKANTLLAKSSDPILDTLSLIAAIDTYHLAVSANEQLRQTFPSLEYKQFLSAQSASLYEQAIRASLQAHELGLKQKDFLAEAFYFSEKSKAATLLEATRTAEARSFAGIPDTLVARENELKRELTYWENELYQASDDSAQQILRNQAFETREAYNMLIEHLEESYPDYYQLKYDTEVVGLAQLQAKLPSNATLLSFSYGDSTLYSFVVRTNTVEWYRTPLDSTFRRCLEGVLQTISHYDYQEASNPTAFRRFTQEAHQLYQTLVEPAFNTIDQPTDQLIIIPDGLLGYLPFDVLLTEANRPALVNYQTLPYLVKQLPVSYEYSATLLSRASKKKSKTPYSYLGFAPTYPEAPIAESREVRATLDGQLLGLGQLRHNRKEVAFAADLFSGKVFANNTATEQHFKQYAGQSQLLHLSMHAYAHDKNDDFSGLIFTQQTDSTQEDGFLHANELYNLSLNAELAVLSACETGIGTLAPGEGIMSLGRAFKYAGCPNVTMSLWSADDATTNSIMQRFFTHLHRQFPKDKALQQAKLDYLSQAKSTQAHPYYWAAFVQLGDSDPLDTAAGASLWWWIIGGGIIVLVVIAIAWRNGA